MPPSQVPKCAFQAGPASTQTLDSPPVSTMRTTPLLQYLLLLTSLILVAIVSCNDLVPLKNRRTEQCDRRNDCDRQRIPCRLRSWIYLCWPWSIWVLCVLESCRVDHFGAGGPYLGHLCEVSNHVDPHDKQYIV